MILGITSSAARAITATVVKNVSKQQRSNAFASTIVNTSLRSNSSSTAISPWTAYNMAPPDPIIGLNEAYQKDTAPNKVIIGVGAYRDDSGKPYVLPSVRIAEQRLVVEQNLDMEYSGIAGDPSFVQAALQFGYGDTELLREKRIQGVQALSGTGGLRVMGELLKKHGHTQIYVPNPTWGNHIPIFTNSGLSVHKYRYYDASKSNELDFTGMMSDIQNIPDKSCILLHACAHNPTGMDPTMEQWAQISKICKDKQLLPFFDCAYQGFASGNAEQDAAALRMFVDDGHLIATVQSFSKNFGLYGHRIGALSIVGSNVDETNRVISQMKMVIRPMYSNPPRHGARIVSTILNDATLKQQFTEECKAMADRINTMRVVLRTRLEECGSQLPWDHITKQIGMFAYSGMNTEQVTKLRDVHHIYCTMDGRISMAGVTSGNVNYIADAIHDVTK